ncbi:hypothetical protein [Celerinatantimonas sp. YJH-8]|uniref:hypothetical protein n=1 Tax=Celerinatantimonas sp. YJH-8 TaxID=3228714 RepID=UPI0038C46FE4
MSSLPATKCRPPKYKKFSFHELTKISLISFPDNCSFRELTIEALTIQQKKYYFSHTSTSYEKIIHAISQGMGIDILQSSSITNSELILNDFPSLSEMDLLLVEISLQPLIKKITQLIIDPIDELIPQFA